METAQIKTEFEKILGDVVRIQGLPVEQATSVALTILQESGKFKRTAMMNVLPKNGTANGSGSEPATDKQKDLMRKLKVTFAEGISKAEASKLLEDAIARKNGK